ncbi:acetylornithine aminotransferase [Propioniferax innocua]|uniref:Acetylornithine aminotransferase n=2 Tax=Propioniferax innocua TaxID=1753 RepID=A0A542ZB32_9ACTN|nr:acetylornithine aminotransferase [Propioniferax innocua]
MECDMEPTGLAGADASQGVVTGRYSDVMMPTFGTPKRVFVRGVGTRVWDADGGEYLDLLSGLAVTSLGHAHPEVTAAVNSQIATLGHVSNFFATPAQVSLAERLRGFFDPSARVFFTNSGTEANEAAFKVARRTGRPRIIAMEGGFHGRTMGALAITHKPAYREPFEPLPGGVEFVPYGDAEALRSAVGPDVAAVVIEPIQGENGIVTPPEGFLAEARAITREHGALLWLDEIQTGMGRCGDWLSSGSEVFEPVGADIVTLAKGLAGGFPIGACLAAGPAAELLGAGQHGTTFGGNPVAALAGLAVIDVIERDGLLQRAVELGQRLTDGVSALGHDRVDHVRGQGLLRGIVLTEEIAPAVADAALDAGFIINAPRPTVLRLAPPLIIGEAEIDGFIDALPGLLDAA